VQCHADSTPDADGRVHQLCAERAIHGPQVRMVGARDDQRVPRRRRGERKERQPALRHRTEIRAYTGFRECSVADAEALTSWLAEHVASIERRENRVREELLARCRAQLIEPPTPDRVNEITRSALHRAEQALLGLIAARVDRPAIDRLEALIAVSDDDDAEDVLALLRAAPGNVSLDTMLSEIAKLEAIRAIGLPSDLFADVAPTVVAGWRARAAVESPSHLREHPQATKLALLCALLAMREREVTDTLAQLLISTIHGAATSRSWSTSTVTGLLTLEDVLEELVGEIDDEFASTPSSWSTARTASCASTARSPSTSSPASSPDARRAARNHAQRPPDRASRPRPPPGETVELDGARLECSPETTPRSPR
jgi:hypothetical protein